MSKSMHEWKSENKLILNQKNNDKKNIAVNLMGNIKGKRTVALIQ